MARPAPVPLASEITYIRLISAVPGSVDAVVTNHQEIDWEQLRPMEKGRRSPLKSLRTSADTAL